jgi:hypothetical protein
LRFSPTREAEIVDELSQHLDDQYRELIAAGAPPEEAERLTRADFQRRNLLARYMAPLRQANAPPPLTPGASTGRVLIDLWHDLRYAARTASKERGFSVLAVLIMALGIGANSAVFSVLDAVLLRPLPFPNAERVVHLSWDGSGYLQSLSAVKSSASRPWYPC